MKNRTNMKGFIGLCAIFLMISSAYSLDTWSISYETGKEIKSFATYDGKLYAGQAGNASGDGKVLVYDGRNWSTVYASGGYSINALTVFDGDLYAAMKFGNDECSIISYDGANWSTAYDDSSAGEIFTMAVYEGKLYAGTGGSNNTIISYDGIKWSSSLRRLVNDTYDPVSIRALAVYDGKLYAAADGLIMLSGNCNTTENVTECEGSGDNIIAYDGGNWTETDYHRSNTVHALAQHGGNLFAGEGFALEGVSRYNGTSWTRVSPENGWNEILSLASFNGTLYAGENNGDVVAYNGTDWSTSLSGQTGSVQCFASYNGSMYAGVENGIMVMNHSGTDNDTNQSWQKCDANADGHINYPDLVVLAAAYGKQTGQAKFNAGADYNEDNVVDYNDLLILAEYFGR